MIRRLLIKIKCAFVLFKIGAFKELLRALRHQIFSSYRLVCLVRNIEGYGKGPVECKIK